MLIIAHCCHAIDVAGFSFIDALPFSLMLFAIGLLDCHILRYITTFFAAIIRHYAITLHLYFRDDWLFIIGSLS